MGRAFNLPFGSGGSNNPRRNPHGKLEIRNLLAVVKEEEEILCGKTSRVEGIVFLGPFGKRGRDEPHGC